MSTDRENSPSSTPPSIHQRRSSLTPAAFAELFSRSNGSRSPTNMSNSAGSPPLPGSVKTAAVNTPSNQRRRLSITTLGLSGSPNQTSPFSARPVRTESLSSAGSYEDAVDDSENAYPNSQPSPFTRRVSFGAQALREVRGGNGTGNGEGFNWSEALRSRAERTPSIAGVFSTSPQNQQPSMSSPQAHRQRAASIAIMEQPARELPKEPRQNKPDFFQEKILRADFMD